MKKLLLITTFLLAPSAAWAQCNGVFGANTVCGAVTSGPPKPIPFSAIAPSSSVTGPVSSVVGDIATWNNTGGTTLSDSGVGFPIPVPKGGTGGTTFTANLPLLGNGASPFTQGTVSGNTTKFATVTGSVVGCTQYDGSGNLTGTGANCGTAGATAPGGANTQVQYNCSGAFCGTALLTISGSNIIASPSSGITGPDGGHWASTGLNNLAGVNLLSGGLVNWGATPISITASGITGNTVLQFSNGGTIYSAMRIGASTTEFDFGTFGSQAFLNLNEGSNSDTWISTKSGAGGELDIGTNQGGTQGTIKLANLSASSTITYPDTGTSVLGKNSFNAPIIYLGGVGIDLLPPGGSPHGSEPGIPGPLILSYDAVFQGDYIQGVYGGGPVLPNMPSMSIGLAGVRGVMVFGIQAGTSDASMTLGVSRNASPDVTGLKISQVYSSDDLTNGVIKTTGNLTAGSGCANGTYTNVVFTTGSVAGFGATGTVTISGGIATSITITPSTVNYTFGAGEFYLVGDVLTVPHSAVACTVQPTITVTAIEPPPTSMPIWSMRTAAADVGSGNQWGFGSMSSYYQDATIFFGSTVFPFINTGWSYNANNKWNLALAGSYMLGTNNGTTYVCKEQITDVSGTLAVQQCGAIATLVTTTNLGGNVGSGGTPGTYTGVALQDASGGQTYGTGAVATVIIGGGGTVTSATITTAGNGYIVGQPLNAAAPPGSIAGMVLVVGSLATTAAPVSVSQLAAGTLYAAAGPALPTCVTGLKGSRAVVTDATTPTYLANYVSGGAVVAPVVCNGTNWQTY